MSADEPRAGGGTDQLLRSVLDGQHRIEGELKAVTAALSELKNDWTRADEQRKDLSDRVADLKKIVEHMDGHTHPEIERLNTVVFGSDARGGLVARSSIVFIALLIIAGFLTAFVSPILVGLVIFAVQTVVSGKIP